MAVHYFIRLTVWLFREWIAGVIGIGLVVIGALPSSAELPVIFSFAQDRMHDDWTRWAVICVGFIFILVAFHKNVFEYSALKVRLRAALEDLSNSSMEIRLYAISEILEISRSSRKLHPSCMRILANYLQIRHPAQVPGRTITVARRRYGNPGISFTDQIGEDRNAFIEAELNLPRGDLALDVLSIMEAISKRRRFFDDPRIWLDLSRVDLPSIDLEGYRVGRVSFAGANLRHGHFDKCDFSDAVFDGAIISDASFRGAKLQGASLKFARGHRSNFDGANLQKAEFFGADLHDTYIQGANAREADFHAANLWRMDAGLTDFAGAFFHRADIRGAHLDKAVNLTKEQMFRDGLEAISDHTTSFPWSTNDELRRAGIYNLSAD